MNALGVLVLLLVVGGCSRPSSPTASPVARVAHRPGEGCASAVLLVTKDTATAAAVDPVQTQMALIQSRSFADAAPAALNPRGRLTLTRVDASALFSVRVHGDPKTSQATCEWVLQHALEMGRVDRETEQWLGEQKKRLQRDIEVGEAELKEFDVAHGFSSVSAKDQHEMLLGEIKQRGLRAMAPALEKRMVDLAIDELTHDRMARSVESNRRLLTMMVEKEAEGTIFGISERPLRMVDACAPCE